MKYTLEKTVDWQEVEVNGEMVEVPVGWEVHDLTNKISVLNGYSFKSEEMENLNKPNSIPILKISNIKNNTLIADIGTGQCYYSGIVKPNYIPLYNDIIVGLSGANAGKSGVFKLNVKCALNQRNAILRISTSAIQQAYFNHVWLNRLLDILKESVQDSAIPNISSNDIEAIELLVPPLPEQTAIAHILSTQESLVSHYDTLIGLHEKRLDYLSDELLSGRIRLQGGDKGEPYTMVKNTEWKEVEVNGEMVEIPVGWSKSKLRSVIDTYIGGDYGDAEASADTSPVEVYTMHAFNQNYHKAIVTRHLKTSKLSNRLINDGDILLEKSGGSPNNPVGRVFQQEGTPLQPRTAVNFITILKLVPTINKKYIYKVLCQLYKNGITKKYEQKTTGIANLKTEQFLEYETLMPNDINEQTLIATMLSQQESLIAHYKTLRDAEQKRFNWLSDALLSGTYRVKELP